MVKSLSQRPSITEHISLKETVCSAKEFLVRLKTTNVTAENIKGYDTRELYVIDVELK